MITRGHAYEIEPNAHISVNYGERRVSYPVPPTIIMIHKDTGVRQQIKFAEVPEEDRGLVRAALTGVPDDMLL